jgi:hypothetical protein
LFHEVPLHSQKIGGWYAIPSKRIVGPTFFSETVKSKAVPLHAMEALGGRGGIAPTHSRPRHYMG